MRNSLTIFLPMLLNWYLPDLEITLQHPLCSLGSP